LSVDTVLDVVYLAAGLLVGLVVHEYAHALVALRLGDHTPKQAGRLTLDPRPHVDPFGTLLLPAILLLPVLFGRAVFLIFAYAKPQPLNPWNLKKPENNPVAIALAGPAANVILSFGLGAS
jgi:Zn-dependent protease